MPVVDIFAVVAAVGVSEFLSLWKMAWSANSHTQPPIKVIVGVEFLPVFLEAPGSRAHGVGVFAQEVWFLASASLLPALP